MSIYLQQPHLAHKLAGLSPQNTQTLYNVICPRFGYGSPILQRRQPHQMEASQNEKRLF